MQELNFDDDQYSNENRFGDEGDDLDLSHILDELERLDYEELQ